MFGVRILQFLNIVEMQSNPPILYYGFNIQEHLVKSTHRGLLH